MAPDLSMSLFQQALLRVLRTRWSRKYCNNCRKGMFYYCLDSFHIAHIHLLQLERSTEERVHYSVAFLLVRE